jgi:EmrB/QacA subfamily drug resistance transporter
MDTNVTSTPSASPPSGITRIQGFALFSILAALMLTLLLEALDQTIVGTALPKIVGSLQGYSLYTWAVTAYLLASTTMIPIIGKLSDQFGRKWFFVIGVIVFLCGSALSGASQTMGELIAFRALQGLGAGTGIALVFTVVGDIFSPAERARWQGVFSGVYGFASVVGPTVGGWLTDHGPLLGTLVNNGTRWRWVFYINIPIGIIALIALFVYLPNNLSVRTNKFTGWAAIRRIDFVGAVLASCATICLLLGLTWGSNQTYAWSSTQVVGTLVASGVLYLAFFIVERLVAEPLLPLDLLRNRVFAADCLLSLMIGSALLPLVIYLPLFLQGIQGQSATDSGLVITPLTISVVIGAAIAGFVIARIGRYQIVALVGSILMIIGMFLLTQLTVSTPFLVTARNMIIVGLGIGMFFSLLTLVVQNSIPRTRMGVGTGATRYLTALGQTVGVAIVGTVVNNFVASDLPKRLPASVIQRLTPAGFAAASNTQILISDTYRNTVVSEASQQAAAHVPPGPGHAAAAAAASQQANAMLNQVFAALKQSLAIAIQHGFWVVFIFSIVVFLGAVWLKDVPLRGHAQPQPGSEQQAPVAEESAASSAL